MNKTAKTIIWLIIAVVIIGGIWWGISLKHPAEEKEIKVGILAPFSGARAEAGAYLRKGVDLAVNEINSDKTKTYKLKLIFEDSQYEPQIALTGFNKLTNIDGVKFVIGPHGSSEVLAITPIAEANKIIMVVPGAQSNDISSAGDYIFRTQSNVTQEAPFLAKFIVAESKTEPVHILELNTDYGSSFVKAFTPALEENGGKVGLVEKVESKEADFRTQLLKIKAQNPKYILMITTPKIAGQILKQAKELGIKAEFFATSPVEGEELITVGEEAAEGLLYPYPYNDQSEVSSMKNYREKYVAAYNEKPEMLSANIYDALNLLSFCFEKVGDDTDKVKDCLYPVKDYQGASGILSFDENGDVVKEFGIKTVKNGEFVPYEE